MSINNSRLSASSVFMCHLKPAPYLSDGELVKGVLRDLQHNNIDVSQLMEWKADHCQEAESSAERGSSK